MTEFILRRRKAQMNKQKLDELLDFINNPESELQIIFYALIKGDKEPKKLDINSDDLPILTKIFVDSIKSSILYKDDYVVLPLSSADERKKCFYHYDLDEKPENFEFLESLIGNDNINNFNLKSEQFQDIDSLIIVLADSTHEVSLYKKLYPVEIIRQSGFLFFKSKERLERFNDELLRISPKFQALSVSKEIIITDLNMIEKNFGFHDVIKREAKRCLSTIAKMSIVSNIGSLEELVDDVSFARKLTKVAKSSPVINLNIPNEEIIKFAQSYPFTKNKMRFTNDGTKFDLDTRVSKDLFIQILNDDLLTSELTKQYYASLAKDGINIDADN